MRRAGPTSDPSRARLSRRIQEGYRVGPVPRTALNKDVPVVKKTAEDHVHTLIHNPLETRQKVRHTSAVKRRFARGGKRGRWRAWQSSGQLRGISTPRERDRLFKS